MAPQQGYSALYCQYCFARLLYVEFQHISVVDAPTINTNIKYTCGCGQWIREISDEDTDKWRHDFISREDTANRDKQKQSTPFEDFMAASATATDPGKFTMNLETFKKLNGLMTGREWYDKFRDELPFGANWSQAVEAAKRAARIWEAKQ